MRPSSGSAQRVQRESASATVRVAAIVALLGGPDVGAFVVRVIDPTDGRALAHPVIRSRRLTAARFAM
jgi:hypothetical protein